MYFDAVSEVFCMPVVMAAIGGLSICLLNLAELRHVPKESRPDLDLVYWLAFLIWPVLAGFVAYVHNDPVHPLGKLLAFQIGLSCPLILRSMSSVIPFQIEKPLPPEA